MQKITSSLQRIYSFATLLTSAAVLLLYAYFGTFTRLIADDFCSAYFARRLGLLRSIWYWYLNWHGGYADVAVDWLLETISIYALPVILPLVLTLWVVFVVAVIHLHLRRIQGQRRSVLMQLTLATVFVFVVLLLSPHIAQSLYWWNGMRAYTLPLILLTLYIALLQIGVERLTTRRQIMIGVALSFAFAFANGGLGETYVAFQIMVFGFLMIVAWPASRADLSSRFRVLVSGLIGSIAALIVTVAAPGNSLRQEFFPAPPGVMQLFQISLQGYVAFLLDILQTPEKITGLLGAVLLSMYYGSQFDRRSNLNRWLIPFLVIGAFGLSFACFLPAAYGTSEPTPARTISIPVFGLIACLLWAGFLFGQQLPESRKASFMPGKTMHLVILLLIGYSSIIQWQNLYSTRNMYMDFAEKWDVADAQILQAKARGDESVTISALNVPTGPGGDPTDNPRYWVNQCYSLYYGIQVLGPDPNLKP